MTRPLAFIAISLVCAPLFAGQALFRNASFGYGGGSVVDMKPADVNHDGKKDVIMLQEFGATSVCSLITLLGNGDGTFRAPVKTPLPSPGSIAVGDLDGDGNVDVVVAGQYTLLDTYRGNGDGSFTIRSSQKPANIATGSPMVLTDLNGDGKLDLAAATYVFGQFDSPLVTFLGKGDGTFAAGITQPGPYIESMGDIAAGDFNGDGRIDVIESSFRGQMLATGNGDGSFNAPRWLTAETGRAAVPGDFNGDGKVDYVTLEDRDSVASVHLGNGNGGFTDGNSYAIGGIYRGVAVDFDGDGKLDVIGGGNDTVTVMSGKGDGTFVPHQFAANTGAIAVADFDGDHHPDVLIAPYERLMLLHGNGDGTLRAYPKTFFTAGGNFAAMALALADFNGDGRPDAVAANGGISILLNSGNGRFGPAASVAPDSTSGFAIGDVNADGKPDIVRLATDLRAYLGRGDGTFSAAAPATISASSKVFLADANGDGKLDALLGASGSGQLLLGRGDGTFAPPVSIPANPSLIADFNSDGRPDFASNTFSAYTIFLNNPGGGFTAGGQVSSIEGALAAGDFNGDGKADLVEEEFSSRIRMRLGKGDGTFTDLPDFSVTGLSTGGFVTEAVVADFDADGKLDLAFSNHVLLGNGDGTFRAMVTCLGTRPWSTIAAADVDGNGSADLLLLDYQNGAINSLLTQTAPAGTTPFSMTLASSRTTLHPAESVTLTTTVSTSSTFFPSGDVRITADGVFAGFAEWSDYAAVFDGWHPPSLGDHTIVASFEGDDVFPAASATLHATAVQIDPQVAISAFRNSSQQGETLTMFVSVSPKSGGGPQPTGTITVRDGDTIIFTRPYESQRSFSYRLLTLGIHTFTCTYAGDTNYLPGTGTFSHLVTKAIAYIGLSGSPASPLNPGQTLTLQAVVSATMNPGGGSVTFHDGTADVGTAPTTGSFASIKIQPSPGYHSYSATYNGNADLDPVSSEFTVDYEVKASPCTPAANCQRRHAVR